MSSKSPPVMLLHGEQDKQVSVEHSKTLKGLLDENGEDSQLLTEKEAIHSDKVFDTSRYVDAVVDFVGKYLPRE